MMRSLIEAQDRSTYSNWMDYVGYIGMHVLGLGVLFSQHVIEGVLIFLATYLVRTCALMVGYHRYFAHRAFKTSRAFQFVLALLGTTTIQKGVLWWAARHRYHHRYSDTPHDIHSPLNHGFWYAHSGWFLDWRNRDTDITLVNDLARYPELVLLNYCNLVVAVAYGVALYAAFGWDGVFWGGGLSTVVLYHTTHMIGSVCHRRFGYRNFATADNSHNSWWVSVLVLGEGWHNNHHFQPCSARHGFYWWELDPNYYVIRVLEWLGLVWDVRTPSARILASRGHRFDARLAKLHAWTVDTRRDLTNALERTTGDAALDEAMLAYRQWIDLHMDDFENAAGPMLHAGPGAIRRAVARLQHEFDAKLAVLSTPLDESRSDELRSRSSLVLAARTRDESYRALINGLEPVAM
jgi:stearoyl-CoA desaturase (delta-9 desaturase)